MNGLLCIYKKSDERSSILAETLHGGLKSLSHRGAATFSSFILNRDMEYAGRDDAPACIAMGACSAGTGDSHIARSPKSSSRGNILFFEGRLINRAELCERLAASPDNVSDSDVVMRLMEAEGSACFRLLKGFWSLIYLDAGNKTLYGARDHFGCRPLYFCNSSRQFALASESRTLYTLFDDVRSINRYTVIDFLLWGNIGKLDQYFFNGIHSLEPSHFVKYESATGKLTVERYYTLPYNRSREPYDSLSEQQYTDRLSRMMTDSVQKNIQLFDGALAVGVSGGMDSSSLICAAKKADPERTLVAYTTTDSYDGGEIYWAEKVVRHTGVEWIKALCTPEQILENLEEVNRIHNIPLYNASSFAQYRMMEEIRKQGQAVFLDGQGGDEMFGGYLGYFPLLLQSLRRNGEWRNWWRELTQVGNSGMTVRDLFVRRLKLWAKEHGYNPRRLTQRNRKDLYEALTPHERERYFEQLSPVPEIKKEILNDALFESYTMFLGNILRWGEHSAASQGIECVMPLSDNPDLTEFVFSIPSTYKMHDGWNKYLQRKAMLGTVPDEICRRRQKMGFYIPEQNWLNEMGDAMLTVIQRMDDPEGCINRRYLVENRNRLYTPANPLFQQFVFRCYSYLLWRNGLA
ncbi:MAG: asparagine synthetase B [Tannerella sp.]|jgi:asparagine synthase (glutamine-hydrolysing)|nr:asparagine synthetase B [Tannerella sp.]